MYCQYDHHLSNALHKTKHYGRRKPMCVQPYSATLHPTSSPTRYTPHPHPLTLVMSALLYWQQPSLIQSVISMFMVYIMPNVASLTWIHSESNISLLSDQAGMAVGVYNNSVWLCGNRYTDEYQQLLEIDIINEDAMSHQNSISFGGFSSQQYFQLDTVLFMAHYQHPYILGYDLHLKNSTYNITKYNTSNDGGICITGNEHYLFRIGGSSSAYTDVTNVFYVYNFNTETWLDGPSFPIEIRDTACNALHTMTLYVIGGTDGSTASDSVFTLDVSDPYNNPSWTVFPASLSIARSRTRSVVDSTYIYVIGGLGTSTHSEVDIIDTVRETVVLDSSLLLPQYGVSAVIVDGVLYSFGGWSAPYTYEYYQYAVLPTSAPTNAPTMAPSIAPSIAPTAAPSIAPTVSPSACVDFYEHYNSSDGVDVIASNIIINNETFPSDAVVQTYIASADLYLYGEDVECDDINADICFIACYYPGICAKMRIMPIENSSLKELKLVCSAKQSCDEVMININMSDTQMDKVSILCTETLSCVEGTVLINASKSIDLSIECFGYKSCMGLSIQLMHRLNDAESINATILCHDGFSCDEMVIYTDNSKNIFISLQVLRYSEDINIHNMFLQTIEIKCGSDDDRRYIRYDNNELLDASEVLQLARNEYDTTRRMPCEDIHLICTGNNTEFYQDCDYEYVLNFSLTNLLKDGNRPKCYWLDIGQLYHAQCVGTCGDSIVYYRYNKRFEIDIIFHSKTNDTANTTKSYRKCVRYFGSNNDTTQSLRSIGAVFEYVLDIIVDIPNSILHNVFVPPETALREEVLCVNKDENVIKIRTNVTVEANERNEANIDALFDEDNQFVNGSVILIAQLFGIVVTLEVVESVVLEGIKKGIVVAIIIGAVCVIVVIVLLVIRSRRKRKKKLEAMTMYMRNPMVITFGIGLYDEDAPDPQVDGYFNDLPGIDKDIQNMTALFGDKLHYDVFPNYDDGIKQEWTLDEVRDLLQGQAKELEDNVVKFDENGNKTSGVYDGLVTIISCHGITDYIVTSDYRKIQKTALHRMFSTNKPEVRKIPRLFIFDCCDGEDERNRGWRTDTMYRTPAGDSDDDHKDKSNDNSKGKSGKGGAHEVKAVSSGTGKNIERTTVRDHAPEWLQGEENPDFKLITVHASNEGYQAKMDSITGSYLITEFAQKMTQNIIDNDNKKFLFEIMDDIQSNLHDKGKQLTECKFNNGTRYIKFITNENESNQNVSIEGNDSDAVEMQITKKTGTIPVADKSNSIFKRKSLL